MPRIAVAIFVVVAVSVSIGINIARYPAVFVVAGSTHESLVSDDTKDVSETEETEGTVAVTTIPALPDEDLAKWNPPIVTEVKPTVTEAVPHVASHEEYAEDPYEPADAPSAEAVSEPRADSPAEAAAPANPEFNHYEVEPYRPYTEDRGDVREERREEETPVVPEQPAVSPAYDTTEAKENETQQSAVETSSSSVWDRPVLGEETSQPQPESQRPVLGQAVTRESTPRESTPRESTLYRPVPNEVPMPGSWPATVADSFQYKQEVSSQASDSASSSFYESKPLDQEPRINAQSVSSTSPAVTPSSVPSVRKPLRLDDSAIVFEEESDWEASNGEASNGEASNGEASNGEASSGEASVPLVATLDNQSSREEEMLRAESSRPQIKRLPVVEGADALPGALPPSQAIAYPVTR